MAKELLTVLRLDGSNFKKNLSDADKQVLKFSGAMTAAGAAVLAAAKFTAEYQDVQIKSARVAGVSAETFSAYNHAAELSGVNNEQLTKTFGKLAAMTPTVASGLNSLGIAHQTASGEAKDSEALLNELAATISDFENPADKAAAAIRVFGEEGAKVVNLLDNGPEGLAALTEEARAFGRVVTEEAGVAAEKFNDDLAKVGMVVGGVRDTVMTSVIAWVNQTGILKKVQTAIATGIRWWNRLDKGLKDTIITAGALAVGIGVVTGAMVAAKLAIAATLAVLSPAVIIIGAVVAASAALAIAVSSHWEQISGATDGVAESFRRLGEDASEVASGVEIAYQDMKQSAIDFLPVMQENAHAAQIAALEWLGVADAQSHTASTMDFLSAAAGGLKDRAVDLFPTFRDGSKSLMEFAGETARSTGLTEKFADEIDYLGGIFEKVKEALFGAADPIKEIGEGIENTAEKAGEAAGEVSVLGTVTKAVFFGVGTAIDAIITGYRIFIGSIKDSIDAVSELGKVSTKVFEGDFEGATETAKAAARIIGKSFNDAGEEILKFRDRTKKGAANVVVRVNTEDLKKAREQVSLTKRELGDLQKTGAGKIDKTPLEELDNAFKKSSESWKESIGVIGPAIEKNAALGLVAISKFADKVAGAMSKVTGIASKLSGIQAEQIKRATQRQTDNFEIVSQLYSKMNEEVIQKFEKSEQERLEKLKASEDAIIEQMRQAEISKIHLLETAAAERALRDDAEYQARKAEEQRRHEENLEAERLRYEQDLLRLDEKNLTEEERRGTEVAMEKNWNLYREFLQKEHQANLDDLAKEHAVKKRAGETKLQTEISIAKEHFGSQIESAEAERNARLEGEQAASDQRIEALRAQKEANEKAHQKLLTFTKWRGEVAATEATKGAEITQIMVAGMSGASQAFSAMAPIPFVGPALGMAASAAIMLATARSANMVRTQVVPPPAALFMRQGGAISERVMGGPGAGDVVPIQSRPGEAWLDLDRTRAIQQFVDDGLGGGGGDVILNFHEGAIQGLDINDEASMDEFGRAVAIRVQRELAALG